MDGELPAKTKSLQEVTTASAQVKRYISRLTDGLDQLYANQKPTAFHSADKKLEIRFGCGLSIDKMVLLLGGLNSELSLLETEINSWSKWWAPWGTPATEVAARVANVLRRFEESTAEFEASLTQVKQPSGNDVTASFTRDALLFDELRCAFKTVSKAEAELQGLLSRMGGKERITNVQLLGHLTQLWPGDERHIEGALKVLPKFLSDILHTEQQLNAWRESGEPRVETLDEFVDKKSKVMGAFRTAMSNLVKQVVSSTGS